MPHLSPDDLERHSLTSLLFSKAVYAWDRRYSQKHAAAAHTPRTTYVYRPPPRPPVSHGDGVVEEAIPECPRLPPRAHSITPAPPEGTRPTTPSEDVCQDEQLQCLLLQLPRELRLLIYEYVIGNRVMHITRRRINTQQHVRHTSCKSNGDQIACRTEQCRGYKLPNGLFVQSGSTGHSYCGIIELLQVCRKVYVDAIHVLYASNTFDFDSMECFAAFSIAILPRRLDSIQQLQLDLRFNTSLNFSESTCFNDWPRWERIWRIIASMPALQCVRARITWPRPLWASEEKRFLEPLLLMPRGFRSFMVFLPRLKGADKLEIRNGPFQLVRSL